MSLTLRALLSPETAGRSLEELEAVFAASQSVFDTVSVAKHMPKLHLTELQNEKAVEEAEHVEYKR